MAIQSSAVATTTFKIVKKGYDPDEVRAYLQQVAGALQNAQDHAASVEARARQAIARAQEAAQHAVAQAAATPSPAPSARDTAKADDTETISRTLLLAQKTADETVAAAEKEAAEIRAAAAADSERLLAEAAEERTRASESARTDARRAGESERARVESELQQLLARLEFLRDDVTQMDAHAAHHRERLLQVADELQTLAVRPAAGLGDLRRPVLSAAADLDERDLTATQPVPIVPGPALDPPEAAHRIEPADVGIEAAGDAPEPEPAEPAGSPEHHDDLGSLFASGPPDWAPSHDPDITAEVPVVE